MTRADKAIIEANPTKTSYELLPLGLSQKGFDQLNEKNSITPAPPPVNSGVRQVLVPKAVEPTIRHVSAQPSLRPPVLVESDVVRVKYKPTGKIMPMAAQMAHNMAARYPNDFQIV